MIGCNLADIDVDSISLIRSSISYIWPAPAPREPALLLYTSDNSKLYTLQPSPVLRPTTRTTIATTHNQQPQTQTTWRHQHSTLCSQTATRFSRTVSTPPSPPTREQKLTDDTDDSEQYKTAASNLHNLKQAIYRTGYDKGYEQAWQDAEKLTDDHVEALLQMGRDVGWTEAREFTSAERARLLEQRAKDDCIDRCDLSMMDEPIRIVHWFRCAKKCFKAVKAKVAKARAKTRDGKVAHEEENEWFGLCGR